MFNFDPNIFPKTEGAYIVGGSLRDLFLDRFPSDYDIVVLGDAEQFAKEIALNTHGHMIELGKHDQRIIRVVSDDKIYDISPVTGTSIEKDLEKRDFTINAMAYNLSSGKVIDNFGGMDDLFNKRIRMVSKEIFKSDPVRLIRAFRIGASLNFEIDPRTESIIRKDADLIQNSAAERIRTELFKMLRAPISHHYLCAMADAGLLFAIFPELGRLKGCIQNKYHLYDVFEHTMKAYYYLETIFNDVRRFFPETYKQIGQTIGENETALLKCAVLLHDIGKPSVRIEDEGGNIHFYGHGQKGAESAKDIFKRLKFSTAERLFIDFIIRNHIRPMLLYLIHQKKVPTRKSLTRFFIKCKDHTPYILLHSIADMIGKDEENEERKDAYTTFAKDIMHEYYTDYIPRTSDPPLLTGNDLIDEFDLSPSPQFKAILDFIEETRLLGRVTNREEALKIAKDFIK